MILPPHTAKPDPWQASWIGLNASTTANRLPLSLFRKEVVLDDAAAQVTAWISADVHYRLYINGRLVSRGPADIGHDYPWECPDPYQISTKQWFYDRRDLTPFFRKGKNVIAAEVFSDSSAGARLSAGKTGFLFEAHVRQSNGAETIVKSDETWRGVPGDYIKGAESLPAGVQLPENCPLCCVYVAGNEPADWQTASYDDSAWPNCSIVDSIWEPLAASEIPPCMESVYPLQRVMDATPGAHIPENAFLDHEPVVITEDCSFALKYDRVLSAYVGIKVKGSAGAVLLFRWEEMPGDANRNTACVLRDGLQCIEFPAYGSFSTLRIQALNVTRPIEIQDVRAVFTSQPVAYKGSFECSDPHLNRIWEVSRWVVQICMQSHHLDSPHHQEPISDPGDYLIESLVNYQAFGDPWLVRQDLRKFALLMKNLDYRTFHTSYTLLWLQMLIEYYNYTGDKALLIELAPEVHGLLDTFTSWRGKNGLICNAPNYMFMDWVTVAGFSGHHLPAAIGMGYMSAFYYQGLKDAALVAELQGDKAKVERYEQLRKEQYEAFNRELWNEEKGLYRDGKPFATEVPPKAPWLPADKDVVTFTPQVNALAVLYDLAPREKQQAIIAKIMALDPLDVQPYFMHFVLDAISHAGLFEQYFRGQMKRWEIIEPTHSFYENWDSGDLSHGWRGTPLYQMSTRILGIKPIAPGFEKISIRPVIAGLDWAKGAVPTPHGKVEVEWRSSEKEFCMDVTIPKGATAEIAIPIKQFRNPVLKTIPEQIKVTKYSGEYLLESGCGLFQFTIAEKE